MTQPNTFLPKSRPTEVQFEDMGRPLNPEWLDHFETVFSGMIGPLSLSLTPKAHPGMNYVSWRAQRRIAQYADGRLAHTTNTQQVTRRLMEDGLLDEKLTIKGVGLRIVHISAVSPKKNPDIRYLDMLLRDADCSAYKGRQVGGERNVVRRTVLSQKPNIAKDPFLQLSIGSIDHPEIPLNGLFFKSLKNAMSSEVLFDPIGGMGRPFEEPGLEA